METTNMTQVFGWSMYNDQVIRVTDIPYLLHNMNENIKLIHLEQLIVSLFIWKLSRMLEKFQLFSW